MDRIVCEMKTNPKKPVTLKPETDILCEACPNNEAGFCSMRDKVRKYDDAVLKACGLTEGDVIPFAEFIELVRQKIIYAGIRCDICGDCSWDHICGNRE